MFVFPPIDIEGIFIDCCLAKDYLNPLVNNPAARIQNIFHHDIAVAVGVDDGQGVHWLYATNPRPSAIPATWGN